MAFADKLGSKYTAVKDKVNLRVLHIKTDEAEFDLKVRIPFKQEMESINEIALKKKNIFPNYSGIITFNV